MKWRKFNGNQIVRPILEEVRETLEREIAAGYKLKVCIGSDSQVYGKVIEFGTVIAVSYTHLRAHETVLDLVCRLLLEKKKQQLITLF